jgi:hypothetical protein
MSTTKSTTVNPNDPKDDPTAQSNNNPFDTIFDGEDTEDEWWEEEDTPPQSPNKAATPIRITQWPKPPGNSSVSTKTGNRMSIRKPDKRYSVQKPTRDKSTGRQKKQNAKAGIKLVTNLTRHQAAVPVQLQPAKAMPQMGCFVDLAALQALNGEPTHTAGFWKSKKGKELTQAPNTIPSITTDDSQTSASYTSQNTTPSSKGKPVSLKFSPFRLNEDLSPGDRPIVIGLSIPTGDVAEHTLSPQTASSETTNIVRSYERRTPTGHTPETPTIIITPAQGVSLWSILDESNTSPDSRPRPASSIYSQATHSNDKIYTDKNAPPVPHVPASVLEEERQRIAGLKSCFSPDSDDATNWDDEEESTTRSRVVSTCTVFEEDESPTLVRNGRARSMSGASRSTRHPSMSTIGNRRLSTGWWNYITTPFLTRSNTFATREIENSQVPALPSLAIAAAKVRDAERDGKSWEKEFSPLTPETTTTISSDRWWNMDSKHPKPTERSPVLQDTRHKVQASTGTLPIVLSEVGGFGTITTSSPASGEGSQLSRDNTTSTFRTRRISGFSSSDREVPMLFDAPNTRALETNNPFVQPQPSDLNIQSASRQVIQPVRATVVQATAPPNPSPGEAPPPPYSPAPARVRKYRAVFPPGHALGIQYPVSPGPISPGMQEAMSSGGAIPMSTVPLTPPARRPINLNSGYPPLTARETHTYFTAENPQISKKAKKAEAKRQRHEKEDAVARRAGGWWRGRGCIPDRGCYGRSGAEGRKRRRWYLALTIGFLLMIVLVVVLTTQLHRKSNTIEEPSQWLNLTGFPPIFTGLSTVIAPVNIKTNTGCVFPATQWSCDLPKELQESVAPNQSDQPNFLLRIQWDNSSSTNITFANVTGNPSLATRSLGGNAASAGQFMKHILLKARQIVTFIPTPEPPTFAEEFFLGNTTDGIVSNNKAGEPTPFYISFLSTEDSSINKRELSIRQASRNSSQFPDVKSIIPSPSLNSDGTAAPANLLPLPSQQPIRLYDRGLPTEHYGFYTYYDRSIFLKSITRLNKTNLEDGAVPDDENGGAREAEARFRCTWRQTRFLVQMWTRMNTTTRLLNSTNARVSNSASGNFTAAAEDFTRPGSFPYPITLTIDRHGGDPATKMLYCYEMNERRGLIVESAEIHDENRGFGGTLVNKAPTFFRNSSDASLGGFDGGNGGCGCKWRNFEDVIKV